MPWSVTLSERTTSLENMALKTDCKIYSLCSVRIIWPLLMSVKKAAKVRHADVLILSIISTEKMFIPFENQGRIPTIILVVHNKVH